MILSLYCMTICFCTYVLMQANNFGDASLIALVIGIFFWWIADYCYDKTINDLRKEIKELKYRIENIEAKF